MPQSLSPNLFCIYSFKTRKLTIVNKKGSRSFLAPFWQNTANYRYPYPTHCIDNTNIVSYSWNQENDPIKNPLGEQRGKIRNRMNQQKQVKYKTKSQGRNLGSPSKNFLNGNLSYKKARIENPGRG